MSIRMAIVASLAGRRHKNTASLESMQARVAAPRPEAPPTPSILKIADVTTSTVGGYEVLTVIPKSGATGTHVIYLHGGAYAGPTINPHWSIVESIVAGSGATVTFPHYGLTPEHTHTDAYELLESIRQTIPADRVFLAGDSAGGGLALGEAMRRRDAGLANAAGVILFSPWVDVTMTNPGIAAIEPHDPLLGAAGLKVAGRWWAAPADPRTPLVSPLFGDLGGLPPVQIYIGGRDILAPDAKLLADAIAAAGGSVDLQFYPSAFHVWVGIGFLPEARKAMKHANAMIRGKQ